ncbi:MAG: glutamate-1-semialdehyde 2,1-aminomutase [Alphaproteobacteria bacterium]|nr:glutamate-1-semialdehyde 2,1-aminomutase [Alphaproteobacteria bacterium]
MPDQISNNPGRLTHALIPGGAHTYSKGDDQFPANAPRYLERGKGCRVWDESGREFIDWTAGLRSMSLGYGIEAVNQAAMAQIGKGSNFGRPSYIETEFAQDLVSLVPCAEMAKFAKNGSTVTTAAVKLARAYTGRDYVALCKDHPFFSYDDWFIGTTPCNAGIPKAFSDLSLTFRYNDSASLERLFAEHPSQIACVILEAATTDHPRDGFLQTVKELCRTNGAVFILDEMITGFRWHLNGAQRYYHVEPDLATFGKGLANGFSVAALVGKREIMDLGGLRHDLPRVFLISTTHGAENHALAAARATLKVFRDEPVIEHMWKTGQALIDGLSAAARDTGTAPFFEAGGIACSPYYVTKDRSGVVSLAMRTLFLQEMIKAGVLINYLAPNFSHHPADVEKTVEAARRCLKVYARALEDGWERYLDGPPIKPVFRPYN